MIHPNYKVVTALRSQIATSKESHSGRLDMELLCLLAYINHDRHRIHNGILKHGRPALL